MTDDTHHRSYRITGRVQGVGFRAFTRRRAQELGVSGWVRNADDGSVEAEARGAAEALAAFEAHLREGPSASRVEEVRAREVGGEMDSEEAVRKEDGFRIVR